MDVFSKHFTSISFYPFTGPSPQLSTVSVDRGVDECDDDYDTEPEAPDQGVDGRQPQLQWPEAAGGLQPDIPESREEDTSSSAPLDSAQTTPAVLDSTGASVAALLPTEEQPLGTLGPDRSSSSSYCSWLPPPDDVPSEPYSEYSLRLTDGL